MMIIQKFYFQTLLFWSISLASICLSTLMGCNSSKSNDPAPVPENRTSFANLSDLKRAMIAKVAGTYSSDCTSIVNNQPVTGSSITISIDGKFSQGSRATDLIETKSTVFTLAISSINSGMAFQTQIPGTNSGVSTYSVITSNDGQQTAASYIEQSTSASVINGCGGPQPSAVGMNLWSFSSDFFNVKETGLKCKPTSGADFVADAQFSSTGISVASQALQASSPIKGIVLIVYDSSPLAGVQFSAETNDGLTISVHVKPDFTFHSAGWSDRSGNSVTCLR